jgi:hypothetical protein
MQAVNRSFVRTATRRVCTTAGRRYATLPDRIKKINARANRVTRPSLLELYKAAGGRSMSEIAAMAYAAACGGFSSYSVAMGIKELRWPSSSESRP